MLRAVVTVVLVVALSSCGPAKPCAKEMQRVRERESLRIHGLSENDALPETVLRFQIAMKCASETDREELLTHAWLLQARLEAKGDVEELDELERLLREMGLEVESDLSLRSAGVKARERLIQFSNARNNAAAESDAVLRAQLTTAALNPDDDSPFPQGTRVLVNHSNKTESCFTVVNHQDLSVGTAMVTLTRADKLVPLHGDATTFGITRGKPKIVRLCVNGPLQTGDVVKLAVGGEPAFQKTLTVTKEDEIRGALRKNFADLDVSTLCEDVQDHSARVACAIRAARRAP